MDRKTTSEIWTDKNIIILERRSLTTCMYACTSSIAGCSTRGTHVPERRRCLLLQLMKLIRLMMLMMMMENSSRYKSTTVNGGFTTAAAVTAAESQSVDRPLYMRRSSADADCIGRSTHCARINHEMDSLGTAETSQQLSVSSLASS